MTLQPQTPEQTYPDPLMYFLDPVDVTRRILALEDILSLAKLPRYSHGYKAEGTSQTWWIDYTRGSIVFSKSSTNIRLELSPLDVDSLNTFQTEPEFVLTRFADDMAWTVERPLLSGGETEKELVARFEYLSDIFYMNATALFGGFYAVMFYDGLPVPERFTEENVQGIIDSYDATDLS